MLRQAACDVTCGAGSKTRVFYSDIMFSMMDFTVSSMWECLLQRFSKSLFEIFTTVSVETVFFFFKKYWEKFFSVAYVFKFLINHS